MPFYGFPYKTVFVSKGPFRIFHSPFAILFLNIGLSEKNKKNTQLVLPHNWEEVKLSVLGACILFLNLEIP